MTDETAPKAKKPQVKKTFGPFLGATEITGPDGKTYTIPGGVKVKFEETKVWVQKRIKA